MSAESRPSLDLQQTMDWILSRLPRGKDLRVLDVAAGVGELSRALAPFVGEIVALEADPALLAKGRQLSAGVENLSFVEGSPDQLPFVSCSFDLIVSRLAFHRFEDAMEPLKEILRVRRPGGAVAIIDLIAPSSSAEEFNRLEQLRDSAHVCALQLREFEALFTLSGARLEIIDQRDVVVDFESWVQEAATPAPQVEELFTALAAEADVASSETGLRPFWGEDGLRFHQSWAIIAAVEA